MGTTPNTLRHLPLVDPAFPKNVLDHLDHLIQDPRYITEHQWREQVYEHERMLARSARSMKQLSPTISHDEIATLIREYPAGSADKLRGLLQTWRDRLDDDSVSDEMKEAIETLTDELDEVIELVEGNELLA